MVPGWIARSISRSAQVDPKRLWSPTASTMGAAWILGWPASSASAAPMLARIVPCTIIVLRTIDVPHTISQPRHERPTGGTSTRTRKRSKGSPRPGIDKQADPKRRRPGGRDSTWCGLVPSVRRAAAPAALIANRSSGPRSPSPTTRAWRPSPCARRGRARCRDNVALLVRVARRAHRADARRGRRRAHPPAAGRLAVGPGCRFARDTRGSSFATHGWHRSPLARHHLVPTPCAKTSHGGGHEPPGRRPADPGRDRGDGVLLRRRVRPARAGTTAGPAAHRRDHRGVAGLDRPLHPSSWPPAATPTSSGPSAAVATWTTTRRSSSS